MNKSKNNKVAKIQNQATPNLFSGKGTNSPYNNTLGNTSDSWETHNRGRSKFNSVKEKVASDIKVTISPQVWKDVEKCLDFCKDVEFSGIILYKKTGSLKNPSSVKLKVEHFILMDIGTTGYTEFTMDDSLLEFCRQHEGVIPNTTHYIGKLHSHHNMSSYHSGVDIDDILLNLEDNTHYLSIVINNRLELDTRLGTYKESVINEVIQYYDLNDELVKEETTRVVKNAILYDCHTKLEFDVETTVDAKLEALAAKKKTNSYKYYEKTYVNPRHGSINVGGYIDSYNSKLPAKNSKYGFLPALDVELMIELTECLEDNVEHIYEDLELLTITSLTNFTFNKIIEYIFPTEYERKSIQILVHALDVYLLEEKTPNSLHFTIKGYKVIETLLRALYNMRDYLDTFQNNYKGDFIADVCRVLKTYPYTTSSFLQTLHRELTTPQWAISKKLKNQ